MKRSKFSAAVALMVAMSLIFSVFATALSSTAESREAPVSEQPEAPSDESSLLGFASSNGSVAEITRFLGNSDLIGVYGLTSEFFVRQGKISQ